MKISKKLWQGIGIMIGLSLLAVGIFGIHRLGDFAFSLVLGKSNQAATTSLTHVAQPAVASGNTVATAPVSQRTDAKFTDVIKREDFFAEYRMERERTRSQQIELLREIVNNQQSSGETRKEAQKKIIDLTNLMKKELEAEKLIIARGYKDAIVLIQPATVSVVVAGSKLTNDDNARIAEIVARATGAKTTAIAIMAKS